jgi:hypothetical protein
MEQSLLTVVAVSEPREDKNNKTFKMITLQNPAYKMIEKADIVTGEVKKMLVLTPALKASHTAYKESYLDGAPEWLDSAKVGDLIEGRIERKAVEPYEFTGREGETKIANSYTCVVFGDSSQVNWDDLVKAAFERNGHKLAGDAPIVEKKRVDITAGAGKKKAEVAADVDQF